MIVLDASAAYAIADETASGQGVRSLLLEGEKAIAPTLFLSEVANAAWKRMSFGAMDEPTALRTMEAAICLVDEFFPEEQLAVEAVREAVRCNHPVYDMLYLVLARRTGATLFTLDKKLVELCREARVNCIEEVAF